MASPSLVSGGGLEILRHFFSPQLDNRRDILVRLPPSYGRNNRRFPVLYLQDGQNLFDSATSYAGDWGLHRVVTAAARRGLEAILVGIPNMGIERLEEYSPFADPNDGGGQGDRYLDFIVQTVKPTIDREFRTRPAPAHTGIAGSSMGALISLYGFFREPSAFGFAGVLSPSLWFAGEAIFPHVQSAGLVPGRLYLDIGSLEGPQHVARARRMRDLLIAKGYRLGQTLRWLESRCGRHDEASWGRRFARALPFLLGAATA
ncbi:MAG TPA: alpha/beta hydrolase-fold protein [Gemmatimonadales bacterium]